MSRNLRIEPRAAEDRTASPEERTRRFLAVSPVQREHLVRNYYRYVLRPGAAYDAYDALDPEARQRVYDEAMLKLEAYLTDAEGLRVCNVPRLVR